MGFVLAYTTQSTQIALWSLRRYFWCNVMRENALRWCYWIAVQSLILWTAVTWLRDFNRGLSTLDLQCLSFYLSDWSFSLLALWWAPRFRPWSNSVCLVYASPPPLAPGLTYTSLRGSCGHRAVRGQEPACCRHLLQPYVTSRSLRSSDLRLLVGPRSQLEIKGDCCFEVVAPKHWNSLPLDIRSVDTVGTFKKAS